MNRKVVFGTLIALVSILSIVFIILKNLDFAVFFMCVLFALTNASRVYSFKEKGFIKEAGWMKGISIFFAVAALVILIIALM